MPPKKRVLAKVDSNVQIEATKGNQKGKKNKKDTIAAPVPAAEDPATETKVDSNIQVKESKGTRKSRRNKKDTAPETAPAPNAEEPRAETAVDEVRYRSHALCNTDVEM